MNGIRAGMKILVHPATVAWNVLPMERGPKVLVVQSVSPVGDDEVPPYCREQVQGKNLLCVRAVAENGYPFTLYLIEGVSKVQVQ